MNPRLKQACELAREQNIFFVITSSTEGWPYLDLAQSIDLLPGNEVICKSWLSSTSLDNLRANPCLTIAVWDQHQSYGFQLYGRLKTMQEFNILNGLADVEKKTHFPQVERQMRVEIKKIFEFANLVSPS